MTPFENGFVNYLVGVGLASSSGDVDTTFLYSAQETVEAIIGSPIIAAPGLKRFDLPPYGWRTLRVPPAMKIHTVMLADDVLTENQDFWTRPYNSTPIVAIEFASVFFEAYPSYRQHAGISVSGDWGLAYDVPKDLALAVYELAALQMMPSGLIPNSVKLGQDTFTFSSAANNQQVFLSPAASQALNRWRLKLIW